jgi:hypothetical protein
VSDLLLSYERGGPAARFVVGTSAPEDPDGLLLQPDNISIIQGGEGKGEKKSVTNGWPSFRKSKRDNMTTNVKPQQQ